MNISDDGLALIEASEGLVLHAYPDPGTGGAPWTIGYGHTAGVKPGDTCSAEQAVAWLREDVAWAEGLVNRYVDRDLTPGRFDALADFAFNIGPGRAGMRDGFVVLANGNEPTLRRQIDAGNWAGAALEFPTWANPPLPGLVKRRAREQRLFNGGRWQDIA